MDIRSLQYFLAVARFQNITKAAAFLHISQPSLSVQIQNLEEELGKPLFTREKRHIRLTADGKLLVQRAEEILALVDKTTQELQANTDEISGDIAIGSGEIEAMNFVLQTAASLRQAYPKIRYHIFSGDASAITERLDAGLLDFGILLEPVNTKQYERLPLGMTMQWGVLMKTDSPLAEKPYVTAADMRDKPFIVPTRPALQREALSWLHGDTTTVTISATYNLIRFAGTLVAKGFGYAMILDKLLDETKYPEICFRPIVPKMEVQLSLVWKKYRPLSRQATVFLKQLQQQLAIK